VQFKSRLRYRVPGLEKKNAHPLRVTEQGRQENRNHYKIRITLDVLESGPYEKKRESPTSRNNKGPPEVTQGRTRELYLERRGRGPWVGGCGFCSKVEREERTCKAWICAAKKEKGIYQERKPRGQIPNSQRGGERRPLLRWKEGAAEESGTKTSSRSFKI